MSVPQPAHPVIPYADASAATDALVARETDGGGVEFVVAPPAMWRQLLGPVLLLMIVTGAIILTFMLGVMIFVMAPGQASISFVGLALEFGVWVLLLVRLWRIGRCGRLASVIRAGSGVLHVALPSRAWEGRKEWAAAAIADLSVDARSGVPLVLPTIRVRVVFHGVEEDDVRIPWRGGEGLDPVERRLREVLGLQVAKRDVTTAEPIDPPRG